MKLNEYAQAVHENAVAHGWYDKGSSSRRSRRSFTRRFPRRSRSTGREIRSFTGVTGYRARYASTRRSATSRKTSALASRRASPWSFATRL